MENRDLFNRIKQKMVYGSPAGSFLELHGKGEILISGCMLVKECQDNCIKVETPLGEISICGRRLHLEVYRGDILSLHGEISLIKLGEDK